MMPSCDQIGVPIHFHSSTTSGSASLMSLRILPRVTPRQSPSSAILFEMSSDADWPWLASGFFMFSSWKFRRYFICKTSACRSLHGLHIVVPRFELAGPTRKAVEELEHCIVGDGIPERIAIYEVERTGSERRAISTAVGLHWQDRPRARGCSASQAYPVDA